MSIENRGPHWKLTGNFRCRAGWFGRLILQAEVRNGPFKEWRDAIMEDLTTTLNPPINDKIEGEVTK